jgi:hypothetical protein
LTVLERHAVSKCLDPINHGGLQLVTGFWVVKDVGKFAGLQIHGHTAMAFQEHNALKIMQAQ